MRPNQSPRGYPAPRLLELLGLPDVAPVRPVDAERQDAKPLAGEAQVGIEDGEGAALGEAVEDVRGDDVDAAEGELSDLALRRARLQPDPLLLVGAAEEPHLVEEEIARARTLHHGK